MKTMKPFFLYLVIALSAGCGKKDAPFAWPQGIYAPRDFQLSGDPTMYTRNGAINDNSIITEFVNRRTDHNGGALTYTQITPYSPPDTLNFHGDGRVSLQFTDQFGTAGSIPARIIGQTNQDINIRYEGMSARPFSKDQCGLMDKWIRNFNPAPVCTDYAANTICEYYSSFKLQKDGNQFIQNVISFLVASSGGPGECHEMIITEYDNFNPSMISRLSPTDTFVVQHKKLRLVKQ